MSVYHKVHIEGQENKAKWGKFVLYEYKDRLYVRTPKALEKNGGRCFALQLPNTAGGRSKALKIIATMQSDYDFDILDYSMEKYLPHYRADEKQAKEDREYLRSLTIQVAWEDYLRSQKEIVKPTTYRYLVQSIGTHINKVKTIPIYNADRVYNTLKGTMSKDYLIRVLGRLSLILRDVVDISNVLPDPYKPYLKQLRREKKKEVVEDNVLIVTDEDWKEIYQQVAKIHLPFAQYLHFLYLTGCRPSEGVGLTWDRIHDNVIYLGDSLRYLSNEWVWLQGSKNNKTRVFPINDTLRELLNSIEKVPNEFDVVFTTFKGRPINLDNFRGRIFNPIAPDYTLYNLRQTFITKQIEKGTPPAVVAKWCDNSIEVIERHYLGNMVNRLPLN